MFISAVWTKRLASVCGMLVMLGLATGCATAEESAYQEQAVAVTERLAEIAEDDANTMAATAEEVAANDSLLGIPEPRRVEFTALWEKLRDLRSEVDLMSPPERHRQSYEILQGLIQARMDALAALLEEPPDFDEYNADMDAFESMLDDYRGAWTLEMSGAE